MSGHTPTKLIVALLAIMLTVAAGLTACSDAEIKARRAAQQDARATAVKVDNTGSSGKATARATTAPATAAPATATPAPTLTPIPTDTPVALAGTGQWYEIDAVAHSDNDVLQALTLHLLRAKLTDEGLLLRVAFEFQGDSEMSVIGGVSRRDIRLTDSSGNGYELLDGDNSVINFDPDGHSFLPGGGVAGNLLFPLPEGKQPYKLHVPTYETIEFELKKELKEPPLTELEQETYEVDQTLSALDDTLAPIDLRVDAIEVGEEDVTVHLAFVNTRRTGYDLWGPDGMNDAWLIDAERNQYAPIAASDNLADSIAPPDGWLPGQAHAGTITFPMPAAPGVIRFTFRHYPALTLTFDEKGLQDVSITSRTGGPPPPTPTPKPSQVAYQTINQMLSQQARAILEGDEDAYLAPFTPDLREAQRAIFRRMQQVPLSDYMLELSPNEDLDGAEDGELSGVSVWGRYALAGIPEDNDFRYTAEYDLAQQGDSWQIVSVADDSFTPFWFLGDVVTDHSPHFIIFTRPNAEANASTLAAELEAAYSKLQARGLPLEPMNVAFFTSPDEDLYDLTGRGGTQLLGLATAQYSFEDNVVHVNSRAFFINGKAFAEHADDLAEDERASTITHEMVHLALSKESRPFMPPWLTEGLAVYYAEQCPPEQLRTLVEEGQLNQLSLEELTGARSLGEHDVLGESVGYEYLYSGAVITYLTEKYGEDQVMDFYRAYAQVPDAELAEKFRGMFASILADMNMTQMAQEKTPALLQEHFGLALEELDEAVKAWLLNQ